MKRIITMLAVAGMVLALAPAAQAAPIVTPGDGYTGPYRIAFVTTGTMQPTSSVISTYNTFVTTAADAIPELLALDATWKCLGSTVAVSAKTNTSTLLPADPGYDAASDVPIYTTTGQRIADDNADLWDGTIQNPIWYDDGTEASYVTDGDGAHQTWTGTKADGTPADAGSIPGDGNPFGTGGRPGPNNIMLVRGGYTNAGWITGITDHDAFAKHFLALSDPISAIITKSVSETAVNLDLGLTNLTYTIDILNIYTTALGGVVVTDTLPVGVSFVTSAPPAVVTNGNEIIFNIGTLEAGSNVMFTIEVSVTSTVPGVITNVAMFSATNTNVVLTGIMDTAETLLYRPTDLAVIKSASSMASNLAYVIVVTNLSTIQADDVVVTDSLPPGTVFASSIPAPSGISGSDYRFDLGSVAPGAATSILLSVDYTGPLPASVTNLAVVTTTTLEDAQTNNTFTLVSLVGQGVDLALIKTVNPTNLPAGTSNLTYTLSVNNLGTTSAVSVVVTDSLPAGVSFMMAVPPAVQTGNELTFNLGTISAGSGTSIVINAVYTQGLVGVTFTNWAAVYTPTQELSLVNNRASATTVILDPLVDTDGDGMTDCAEIIAGTDPNDPTSYLWVQIERTANQSVRQLTFPSVVTRTYHIQSSTNFNTGPWVNVQTNIPGIDALINFFRTNLLDKTYYRVGVE